MIPQSHFLSEGTAGSLGMCIMKTQQISCYSTILDHHFTSFVPHCFHRLFITFSPFQPFVQHFFTMFSGVHHVFTMSFPAFPRAFSAPQVLPSRGDSQQAASRLPGNGPRSPSCSVHDCWRAAPHGRRSGTAPPADSPASGRHLQIYRNDKVTLGSLDFWYWVYLDIPITS